MSACSSQGQIDSPESLKEEPSLTVCIEGSLRESTDDSLKKTVNDIVSYFNEINDVRTNFKIETLTSDKESRENQIYKLQAEIMAGGGPDIFIFRNDGLYSTYNENEILFKDLNKSIHTGVFADLSGFMNNDPGFNPDDYYSVIMNAGAIDDKQYILPFSFSYFTAALPESKPLSGMGSDSYGYFGGLLNSSYKTHGFQIPSLMLLFDKPIDYSRESLNVEKEDLSKAIGEYAGFVKGMTIVNDGETQEYSTPDSLSLNMLGRDIFSDISKMTEDVPIADYPMPNSTGGYSAYISNGAAISSSCKNQQLAYDFIKLFLSPELQTGNSLKFDNGDFDKNYGGYYASAFSGWPIYKNISLEDIYLFSNYYSYESPLENGDYYPDTNKITFAYFLNHIDDKIASEMFELIYLKPEITEADISKATENIYRELKAAASE